MSDPNPCTPSPEAYLLEVEADERAAAEEADAARTIAVVILLTYEVSRDERFPGRWIISIEERFDRQSGDSWDAGVCYTIPGDCERAEVIVNALHAAERWGLPCYWIDPDGDGTPEELTGDWRAMHTAELARIRAATIQRYKEVAALDPVFEGLMDGPEMMGAKANREPGAES
jgi:hypothetical protein